MLEVFVPRTKKRVVAECAKLLMKPLENYVIRVPNDLEVLKSTLRKGDVLLIEGDQRISQVIRYLTQSSWSHCALYIGDAMLTGPDAQAARSTFGEQAEHLLVEAVEGSGVSVSPLAKYLTYNIRICRPEGLSRADADKVISYASSRIGDRYDLRHIIDLARYFFPVSVVPRRWRSAALTLGRNSERAVICSTMIARGFAAVGYPILPQVTLEEEDNQSSLRKRLLPKRWQRPRARFRRRDPKLVTPRDFDLSPYFQIVKFNHLAGAKFSYQDIIWEDDPPSFAPTRGEPPALDEPEAAETAVAEPETDVA